MNYIEDIYRLAHIKRYSNVPTYRQESVAEHGFFVCAILMELHEKYEFDLGRALAIAVSHDMPEIELNDCPHIIKKKYPEIAMAYQICENRVVQDMPIAVMYGVQDYDAQECVEAKVTMMADVIQCIQYSSVEIKQGNAGYMGSVLANSKSRLNKLKEDLKDYER